MATDPEGRRVRGRVLAAAGLGAWAGAILLVGAFLMAGHLVPLPAPAMAGERLGATLAARVGLVKGRWSAVHVLYEGCGCSSRVLSHLLARGAGADLDETVVYAREAAAARVATPASTSAADGLRGAGFRFEALTPAELEARYQIESAPLLVVADPRGVVRYAGGYTDHSGGTQIADLAIIDGLRSGRAVTPLPIFGCAISRRLQSAIDPLGLKYRKEATTP